MHLYNKISHNNFCTKKFKIKITIFTVCSYCELFTNQLLAHPLSLSQAHLDFIVDVTILLLFPVFILKYLCSWIYFNCTIQLLINI